MNELKPCAKCGSDKIDLKDCGCAIVYYTIICHNCKHETAALTNLEAGGHCAAINQIVDIWNAEEPRTKLRPFMST